MDTVTKDREKYLGGSDIPAFLELSPFKTRSQLLQEKSGRVEKQEVYENIYIKYGNALEPIIRKKYNEEVNRKFKPEYFKTKINGVNIRINVDGLYYDWTAGHYELIEIKTTTKIDDKKKKMYYSQLMFYKYVIEKITNKKVIASLLMYESNVEEDDWIENYNSLFLEVESNVEEYDFDFNKILEEYKYELELYKDPFFTPGDELEKDLREQLIYHEEIKKSVDFYKKLLDLSKERIEELTKDKDKVVYRNITVSKIPKKTKKVFDMKKFKEDIPEIYESYTEEKETKEQIRITIKGDDVNE